MTPRFCDAIAEALPPCRDWGRFPSDWHGCAKPPGHDHGRPLHHSARIHRCQCGAEWGGRTLSHPPVKIDINTNQEEHHAG